MGSYKALLTRSCTAALEMAAILSGEMTNTDNLSARLVRLPFWLGIEEYLPEIVETIQDAVR